MTTHELYVGGPGRTGLYSRAQFPAPSFDNTLAVFKKMPASFHKKTVLAALTRTLDFGTFGPNLLASTTADDSALYNYVLNNPIAQEDILDIQVIPANTLLFGAYCNVKNVAAGVRLAFTLDDATTFGGINELAAPVQTAGSTAAVGGTVTDGDHFYVVTALTALGETTKSNEIKVTAAGGGTSVNTLNWNAVAGATGYRVYRGTVTGVYTTYLTFGVVVTGDDTGAAGTAGSPPATNTSGNTVDCSAVFNKFSVPNGAAWISAGAATLANANFSNVPRMLRAKVVALPAAGFQQLRIHISPLLLQLQEGQF